MAGSALDFISATAALNLFKTKSLSPVELMQFIIDRANAIDASVNPFADKYFEQAMAQAKCAETAYQKGDFGMLEGIPLLVKDASAITGKRCTVGSLMNADNIDNHTDPSIERLIKAGANLFARSTCPEFCWLFSCHSKMWGVTRNPWRLDITPGGSSGGSAAALAAGATTIATGSDSTGSIRQPAAQCGVVGYKSPYGRNPMDHHSSFHPYVNVGPMTRTVADAALMQNVMSGQHPLDHCSVRERVVIPTSLDNVKGMKIAYSMDLGHYHVVDDVRRETLATLDVLCDAGAIVEEVDVNWASEAIKLAHLNQEFVFAGSLQKAFDKHSDSLSDYAGELLETANSATAQDYRKGYAVAGEVWSQHMGPLLQQYDAFITPGVSCPEVPADCWQQQLIEVDGHQITDTETAMTALFNMFNRCAVLSVPAGMTDQGLPVGIQIVSRPYDDITAFQIGEAIEQRRPWLDCAQRRPVIS